MRSRRTCSSAFASSCRRPERAAVADPPSPNPTTSLPSLPAAFAFLLLLAHRKTMTSNRASNNQRYRAMKRLFSLLLFDCGRRQWRRLLPVPRRAASCPLSSPRAPAARAAVVYPATISAGVGCNRGSARGRASLSASHIGRVANETKRQQTQTDQRRRSFVFVLLRRKEKKVYWNPPPPSPAALTPPP